MPRVPEYGQQQVQTSPLPSAGLRVQASPQAFGAGLGQTISGAARVLGDIAAHEKQKADNALVDDAVNQLYGFEKSRVYDDQTGILIKRGREAFEAADGVYTDFDKLVGDIGSKLANEQQREMFRRAADSMRVGIQRRVEGHVAGERMAFEKATNEALVQNSLDAAAANYDDPDRIAMEARRGIGAITKANEGMPAEAIKLQVDDYMTKVHGAVIGRMLAAGDDRLADEYYQANADDINGTERARIETVLAENRLRGEGQRKADTFIAETQDRKLAMEKAKTLTNPKLRDEVESRITRHFDLQDREHAERRETLFLTASADLERSGGDLDGLVRSLGDSWFVLTPGQRQAIEQRAEQLTAPQTAEKLAEQQEQAATLYYDLRTAASSPDPQVRAAFVKADLSKSYAALGPQRFKELTDLQVAMRQEDRDRVAKLNSGFQSISDIVRESLGDRGLLSDGDPEQVATRQARLSRLLDERVIAFQQATGKKPSPTEVRDMADVLLADLDGELLMDLVAESPGRVNAELDDLTIDDIPKRTMDRIRAIVERKYPFLPNTMAYATRKTVFGYRTPAGSDAMSRLVLDIYRRELRSAARAQPDR